MIVDLPPPVGANHADQLTRFDAETDASEDRGLGIVSKLYLFEPDRSTQC